METVYVIVENLPVHEDGEYSVGECICQSMGFYTDENLAQAKVDQLNEKWCKQQKDKGEEVTEDDEMHFGFLPLMQVHAS
jgi:hypothetical protein